MESALVVSSDKVTAGSPNDAFAFAFWGGDFYIFAGGTGASVITQYDPSTKIETIVTTANLTIVGAGVSTCAPLSEINTCPNCPKFESFGAEELLAPFRLSSL